MDINVVVNIDTQGEQPKVEVKKATGKNNVAGGILQFPENDEKEDNSILDMLGIGRT